jgi:PKD repeat protein
MRTISTLVLAIAVLSLTAQTKKQSAREIIRAELMNKGFGEEDMSDLVLRDSYASHNGQVNHTFYRQRHAGIEIFNADIAVHQLADGTVLQLTQRAERNISKRANATAPGMSSEQALQKVLDREERPFDLPAQVGQDAQRRQFIYDGTQFSNEAVKVQLMYQPTDDELRLVWEVSYYLPDGSHWWNIRVDAITGEEVDRNDWVVECVFDGPDHGCHDHGSGVMEMPKAIAAPNDYNVFAWPLESPSHGGRSIQNAPWLDAPSASPYGWHDTNGSAGAEYTITRGNNVHAQEDRNANNGTGYSPDGGVDLDFDFPIDFTLEPITYEDAAISNLFYWNNVIHDVWYLYGFDEASGNFQENNYGNGGAGGDYVFADAQDGSGFNNANFGTPSDGSNPRMQMFLWNGPTPDVDGDLDNGIIAHEYAHGVSNRLVGGPSNVSCLSNAEQMGEGWSDYFALIMTIEAGDTGPDVRGIGTYALDQPVTGPGIRPSPYSTDFGVNSYTYGNTNSGVSQPHGIGFVWCTILWEMTWDLIAVYGLDPDIYNGTGGNNIAMQLVLDGLKLTACNPGFVDGRDAIILADQLNNGGANFDLLWGAFARRGLGYSADQGSSSSRSDQTEAFDLPVDVNLGVQSIVQPAGGTVLDCNNAPFDVQVNVSNGGLLDQVDIPVAYQLDNDPIVRDTVFGNLTAGATVLHQFPGQLSVTVPGIHVFRSWTEFPGDAFTPNDTAAVTIDLVVGAPLAIPYLYDFEVEPACGTASDCGTTICALVGDWFNGSNGGEDDVDWRVDAGGTTSTGTGPSVDFDPGTATGKYVYLETSGTCSGQVAHLNSPCIDVVGMTVPTFSFAYHMFGADMGSLHVDINDGSGWTLNVVPSISGDQGDVWLQQYVDLTPYIGATINIRLRGVTGSGFQSDIALDAIQLFDAAAPPIVDFSASPLSTCGNGVVQISDGSLLGPTSWSWNITPAGYTFVNGTNANSPVIDVQFSASGSYTVELTATNGFGPATLTKVDYIQVTPDVLAPIYENFESEGLCSTTTDCGVTLCPLGGNWNNEQNGAVDDIDWRVNEGGTTSTGTSPSGDFDPGTGTGNYIYLETSGSCASQEAYLTSTCLDISGLTLPTLTYAYHMSGATMGELHVDLYDGVAWQLDIAPAVIGDQGNLWSEASVDLSVWSGSVVNIRFRGITGSSFTSDIALDAIRVFDGAAAPIVQFNASTNVGCGVATISFEDRSILSPTSWQWVVSPGTYTFVNGTNANSQNPEIEFAAPGFYTISLDATNAYGTGSLTEVDFIEIVNGDPLFLTVTTDIYPGEITWRLLDTANTVYGSGGPYSSAGLQDTEIICIPGDNCYVLEFNDSFGDGIFSPGGYVLQNSGGDTLVLGDGQYTQQQRDTFCIESKVAADIRVFLGGPFDGSGLMHDSLRVAGSLPLVEPYTALGYPHVGSGGETVLPGLFAVVGPTAIVDWVMVELRDPVDPSNVVHTATALVNRSGYVLDVEGNPLLLDVPQGQYYVAVRHRNHLGCMSAAQLSLSSAPTSIDFTQPTFPTFGIEPRDGNGLFSYLWSGNVLFDSELKYLGANNDRDEILVRIGGSVPTATTAGYFSEDVNMDNQVKYIGGDNDRDPILVNIGGSSPTAIRVEQLP